MLKLAVAAIAVTTWVSDAFGHSIMQRSDWQGHKFETYLPHLNPSVPWLDLNNRTRRPKVDFPLGFDIASNGPFVLLPTDTHVPIFNPYRPHGPEHIAVQPGSVAMLVPGTSSGSRISSSQKS